MTHVDARWWAHHFLQHSAATQFCTHLLGRFSGVLAPRGECLDAARCVGCSDSFPFFPDFGATARKTRWDNVHELVRRTSMDLDFTRCPKTRA